VNPVPQADCRPCLHAPELEPRAFEAGRKGVQVEPLVGQDGPTVAPIELLVGQAAPKGVVAV
jgi:hypothetical protein